ncbi:hypothetical protein DACRYDRAFT_108023 [Dacryopinax primogenitus]|uniref:Uncharacterized protein n=1 Tax=Dacryopinax primogenitus (strain DJM 731) TaxID=1858805 RepID=M5FZZ8_DACPD|nr:uncharacterized protein DACRYDRAFT_108023 [Dacryopinax primogenitus]EJU01475.1 hypothetical protein DACRYDRAFT_108023 [Dacryopinax primogenitus]
MPAPDTSQLKTLIHQITPASAGNTSLTRELVDHAHYLGGTNQAEDLADLANLMQRHVMQTSGSSTPSLRLNNLLSRLYDQTALSRKYAILSFLYTLSQQSHPTSSYSTISNPPAGTARRRNGPSPFNPSLDAPFSASSGHRGANGGPARPEPPVEGGMKSKAALLRAYRERIGKPHVPMTVLLRDAIYLLQGISGHCVQFVSVTTDTMEKEERIEFVAIKEGFIPPPTRVLLHQLSELGHLHSLIASFLDERSLSPTVGLVEQSLHHELRFQLTEYHKLIALLESHASRSKAGEDGGGLTLMRLEAWVGEWKLRLRLMSVFVEGSKNAHGGKLISLIHLHTKNGDPFIRDFSTQILEQVSKPFFTSLQAWLFAGSLSDPFGEFFVAPGKRSGNLGDRPEREDADADEIDADFGGDIHRTWQEKWMFRAEMMPSFLDEAFGRKVYSTGKSLNFIRYNCHDAEWVTKQASASTSKSLKYSDIAGLEKSIDLAYKVASQRLFEAFLVKYRLVDHLQALKAYLLCGYGDFHDLLMDSLSALLAKPANALYRHTLTTRLLDAIRGSNAQYDPPDVLRRLDARMMEYSHGEIGWDVFTLEYKVDPPIDTVIDPDGINNYLKLFNHLWKMRRVEGSLGAAWGRVTSGARSVSRVADLQKDWHQVRLVMAEMIHFVRQMHAWCHREVIGAAWKDLTEFIHKKEGDLDGLIEAHNEYLSRMVRKITLQDSKRGHENNLATVREIFETILQFLDSTDDFWRYTTHAAHIRDRERDNVRGVYTALSLNTRDPQVSEEALSGILSRTKEFSGKFSHLAGDLVISLSSHSDLDIRFLAVSLTGFSTFYPGRRDSSRG